MPNELIHDPIPFLNENGDIPLPAPDAVSPQPQKWAEEDLRRDHPHYSDRNIELPSNESIVARLKESSAAHIHRISEEDRIRGIGHIARIRKENPNIFGND